ncbi:MAG: hypothetical protein LUI10_06290 [Lachnospiraceae bacterium]|nr:hypothetical protein [Lachnospiraceae bacterium]
MAVKAGKDTGVQTGTPYDDVLRTLLNDCRQLVIQLVNEVFGENYTGEEEVVFSPNEHFLNQQDGGEDKRITDTTFSIIGTKIGKYLLECQTNPDSSMLVRIFEYSTQVALDESKISGDTLEVVIPNCAILFLRSTRNTPEQMHIRFQFREEYFTYDIPVIKMQQYTLEDLLRKNLLFLLPFYIFTYDRKLQEYNTDEGKLSALKTEYQMIMTHLNNLEYHEQLSTYYKKTIVEMTEKVVDNLTAGYANIRKEVRTVMGGKILEYEAKTILRQGEQKGKLQERQRNEKELAQMVKNLMANLGWTAEQTFNNLGLSREARENILKNM